MTFLKALSKPLWDQSLASGKRRENEAVTCWYVADRIRTELAGPLVQNKGSLGDMGSVYFTKPVSFESAKSQCVARQRAR